MSVMATGQLEAKPAETGPAPSAPLVPGVPGVPGESGGLVLEDLKDLMQTVTETSQQLQQTHMILQREVARLQHELAEANAQLQRSRSLAALGGMAAGIAHEIRNPLGSIQLYVQMLAEDVRDRPEQAELCGKIDRAVSSLDAIVSDVLLFSREVGLNARPTTAKALLERAVEGCAALLARDGIDLHVDAPDDLTIVTDELQLTQALGNLIRNAIEAMVESDADDNGEGYPGIRLTARRRSVRCPDGRRASRLVLGVEDRGPGIPDDISQRMFNPFFTTRAAGTGLGLAIVHRIVDAHGGHINVKRIQPHGTRIEICLRDVPLEAEADPGSTTLEQFGPETEIETYTRPLDMEHGR